MNHQTSKSLDCLNIWDDSNCNAGDEACCGEAIDAPTSTRNFTNTLINDKGNLKAEDFQKFVLEEKKIKSTKAVPLPKVSGKQVRMSKFAQTTENRQRNSSLISMRDMQELPSDEKKIIWSRFKKQSSSEVLGQILPQ